MNLSMTFGATQDCAWIKELPVPVLLVCPRGVVLGGNAACRRLFGHELTGAALTEALQLREMAPTAEGEIWTRAEATDVHGVPFAVDVATTLRADGSRIMILRRPQDAVLVADSVLHLDAAFEHAPIGMAFFDTEGRYIRVNRALCQTLGRSADELLGMRDQELTHPDDRQSDVDAAWRILRGELDTWQTEKRFIRADGQVVWVIANMTFLRDDVDRPLTWLGQFQDITLRKALEEQLRNLAEEDALTGVANRRRLDTEIDHALALAHRYGQSGALIYVDLDGFKAVNDTHGHATGDALLRAAAGALRGRCRGTDTVARIGGDEFAVLLPVATAAEAETLCRDLQELLDATDVEGPGGALRLRASLGVSCFGPEHALTAGGLIEAADRAMYAVKALR